MTATTDIHVDQARELRDLLAFSPQQIRERSDALNARRQLYVGAPSMRRHCRAEAGLLTASLDPVDRAHLRLYADLLLPDGSHC